MLAPTSSAGASPRRSQIDLIIPKFRVSKFRRDRRWSTTIFLHEGRVPNGVSLASLTRVTRIDAPHQNRSTERSLLGIRSAERPISSPGPSTLARRLRRVEPIQVRSKGVGRMCNQALGEKLKISFEVVLDFGEKKLHTVRGGIARLSSENRMVTCRIGMFGRRCFFGNLYVITCYSPKLQLFDLIRLSCIVGDMLCQHCRPWGRAALDLHHVGGTTMERSWMWQTQHPHKVHSNEQ